MGHFRDPFSYYSAGNAVAMMDTRDGGYFYVDNYVWLDYNFALKETYKEILQKFDGEFNLKWHYVNPPDFGVWRRMDYIHDLLEPTSGTYVAVGNMSQIRPGSPPPTAIYEDFMYLFCAKNGTPKWYRITSVGTQTHVLEQLPSFGDTFYKRHSLAPAPNGDFYVAGYTWQPNNSYLARLSDEGEERWLVRPKPTGYSLRWLKRTSESNVLIAGGCPTTTASIGGWAAVHRADGSLAWTQEYPQIQPRALDNYPDGGFVLAGAIPDPADNISPPRVVRMGSAGQELWRQTLPQEDFYQINGCIALGDGGCLVVGRDSPTSRSLASAVRLDGQGKVHWKKKFGQQFLWSCFQAVHRFPNGEILLIGTGRARYDDMEEGIIWGASIYLVKLAAERTAGKEWERYANAQDDPGTSAAAQAPPSGEGGPAGGGGPRNLLVWIAALAGLGAVLLIVLLRAARVRRAGKSGPRLAPPVL